MGECCQVINEDHSLTTELMKTSGIVVWVLLASWMLLGVLSLFNSFCLNIESKFKMIRYFVFTLTLLMSFSLIFNSMNGLAYYVLQSNTDVFNTVLSTFLNIFFILAIVTLWVRTYQMTTDNLPASIKPASAKVHNTDKMS